jgi:hypothetical protein
MPFTDADAFEAIADAFENESLDIKIVNLKIPPGKIAYEILIPQPGSCAPIYAKVQLGPGQVLARSFHYSDYAEKPHEHASTRH